MARQQAKTKEPTFGDLTFEVNKLNTAQLAHGKDSNEYKTQHAVSVKLVEFLNSVYGQGYASLSHARSVIQSQYIVEKAKKLIALEKSQRALKNTITNKKSI